MKAAKKMSGFFIVEILIVLIIIGILVTALMPNLTTYTKRAQFVDNITAAGAIKPAVEGCIIQNNGTLTTCNGGTSGIPSNVTASYGGFVNSLTVSNGTITATPTTALGATNTYILVPTYNSTTGVITWSDSTSGCKTPGYC